MRVVVDTNVLVSAALKRASLPALALRLLERHGTLLKSTSTERQIVDVLARPKLAALIDPTAIAWIGELIARAEQVTIAERIAACRDPTDDRFLELAVSGGADVILTGDGDLLALHPFRGIPVQAPAAFVRAFRATS
jgi:putative PIN family toxin of toxin-antitoxin system